MVQDRFSYRFGESQKLDKSRAKKNNFVFKLKLARERTKISHKVQTFKTENRRTLNAEQTDQLECFNKI